MTKLFPIILFAAFGLVACKGPGSGPPSAGGGGSAPHLDQYCVAEGLAPPQRQTVLVIDERSIVGANDPAEIRQSNIDLFNLAISLGDPVQAIQSGVSAPRERLSIYIAPVGGGAPRLIFTGCLPGLSESEKAAIAGRKSKVAGATDAYFGTGAASKMQEGADDYRRALLGALINASRSAKSQKGDQALVTSSLMRSLQGVRQLAQPEQGVPRIFILTDLSLFKPAEPGTREAARTEGFAAADTVGLSLGRAEVHLVGRNASPLGRDLADAFVLGSQGFMQSWGATTFSTAPAAPVKVLSYVGKIDYGGIDYPMQLRIGVDRNGALVDSWITVKLDREYSTPITGAFSCDGDDNCHLTSDQGGLAQLWSRDPDPEPEFDANLPMGGLRYIEASTTATTAEGRVFDPSVDRIGTLPGSVGLRFNLRRSQ